jgi:hypothetical protein
MNYLIKTGGYIQKPSVSFFILIFWLLFNNISHSQTTKADSVKTHKADSARYSHSPKKATLLSAALPGTGQIYNKKYWKLPLIYGGLGTTIYLVKFYNDLYLQYHASYVIKSNPTTANQGDDEFKNLSKDQVFDDLDYYRRNRDLSGIIAIIIYALNIVDASVDAHLFYFDVSDNLSMKLTPSPIWVNDKNRISAANGITVSFNFK